MEVIKFHAEDPSAEIWRRLLRYSYHANVSRRYKSSGIVASPQAQELVTSAILQGYEYFSAASQVTMRISPLLLYYGAINLCTAAAVLRTGQPLGVVRHGMSVVVPDAPGPIGDVAVTAEQSPKGALFVFLDAMGFSEKSIFNARKWSLQSLLSSLPDLRVDFEHTYRVGSHVVPVDIVRLKRGFVERIRASDIAIHSSPTDVVARIRGLGQAYLPPQFVEPGSSSGFVVVLNRRKGGKDIGTYSLSGEKHLKLEHQRDAHSIEVDPFAATLMALFVLGAVSRYHAPLWQGFVANDQTGERLVVERFIAISKRRFPNMILDMIEGARHQVVSETTAVQDLSKAVESKDVEEMIDGVLGRRGLKRTEL